MTKQALDRLRTELDRLRAQKCEVEYQIKALERAIALVEGADEAPPSAPQLEATQRRARMPIKDLVLGILVDHEATGLSAAQVVETAAKQGVSLDRASVSSLLSRLKKEGVLVLEGNAYKPSKPGGGAVLVAHPKQAA